MAGLRLYTSNRLELLAGKMAGLLQPPLSDPFASEIILVQSRGMERWLAMELARRHGICANIRFPFPDRFLRVVFRALLPGEPEESPEFSPVFMTWKIFGLIPGVIGDPVFRDLAGYLADDPSGLKRFQLAGRIAGLFDLYLLYRPEMILRWEDGEETHWQAALWRLLVRGTGRAHRAALLASFLERAGKKELPDAALPSRISVFGISFLPPFHLRVLEALSRTVDVNLLLLNPCREYWADIVSDREMVRIESAAGGGRPPGDLHLEAGNILLASMGAAGRDFFETIYGMDVQEESLHAGPEGDSLLASIQADILDLRDRGAGGGEKKPVSPGDLSVQVHVCHGPMREIEVLQDYILSLFESEPTLRPCDVAVMAPDIEKYAPLIEAVFSLPRDDPRWIPFGIADRGPERYSESSAGLLRILGLRRGRMGAAQVMDILEIPALRRKFSLTEEDLEKIRGWVRESGIRWGIDESDRRSRGLPFRENTWKAGLDRMLLGYALPGGYENDFLGIAPFDRLEGSDTAVFDRLLAVTGRLFLCAAEMEKKRTPSQWADWLAGIMDFFFLPGDDEDRWAQSFERWLADLRRAEPYCGSETEISIEVVDHALRKGGVYGEHGSGFLAGGVTFCAMLPMRSIPFRAVCLIGMDDEAFPRGSPSLGFDLVARFPRRGDRSRRGDDRYLFLETILSARDRLYISYAGRDIRDNCPRPPSVLVSELLDYVEQGFEIPGGDIREHLTVRHRLQAFSPAYFDGTGLFSYSKENLEAAARACASRGKIPVPFFSARLPAPEEIRELEIEEFSSFFADPARYFLSRRLGIRLEKAEETLSENEPLRLEGLERYRVGQFLAGRALAGFDPERYRPALISAGILPPGAQGLWAFGKLSGSVRAFAGRVRGCIADTALESAHADITAGGLRIRGRIETVMPDGFLQFRFADLTPSDRIHAWIRLLVFSAARRAGAGRHGTTGCLLAGRDGLCRYEAPAYAGDLLEKLVEVFREGLCRPVAFFPESSMAFAESMAKKDDPGGALRAAGRCWRGNEARPGEGQRAWNQICFRGVDPLNEEFMRLARDVLGPLLDCEKREQ